MDIVDRNTLAVNSTIVNQSPATGSATDPRLDKTANSPQSNYDVDEDGREIHKIYHFHNCGTVYVDARSSHRVTMENCANSNVRRVTCSSFPLSHFVFRMLLSRPCHVT
ncbi:hypothetical protein BYT27DRAFT_6433619 [Phlegmacium glaucopus]|nr:hypothetical protein BYT27DRAFT_6433619 [Phlegmacium glaucopus]